MLSAVYGLNPVDRRRAANLMISVWLKEALDQLTLANVARCCGHVFAGNLTILYQGCLILRWRE